MWHATQCAELRANLIDRLLRDNYIGLVAELSPMNSTPFEALETVYTSKSRILCEMRGPMSGKHRDIALEMILSAQVRLYV